MNKVISDDNIRENISEIRTEGLGLITNFFQGKEIVDLWISHELLFDKVVGKTYFIFRKNEGFYNLFFNTISLESLLQDIQSLKKQYPDTIFIVDVVGNEKTVTNLAKILTACNFEEYVSLVRMSRLIMQQESLQNEVGYAEMSDINKIYNTFVKYFDPFSEQLPLKEQIEEWIIKKHLLVKRDNGKICGFLIFNIIGMTSYLRYWFVFPEYRDKHVGSQLLRQFFYEANATKRQILWVIIQNENAIKRYVHYGFKNENMWDKVLISR